MQPLNVSIHLNWLYSFCMFFMWFMVCRLNSVLFITKLKIHLNEIVFIFFYSPSFLVELTVKEIISQTD